MSDWENEDFDAIESVVLSTKKKWDDEDVEDNQIKESWEDSEDESSESEAESAAPPPTKSDTTKPGKKRMTVAQKIAQKNASQLAGNDQAEMSVEERREAQLKLERNADEENAADLFAGMTIKDQKFREDLATMNPRSKEDFDQFRKILVERITSFSNQRHYPVFVDALVRELCVPLKDTDVRKAASTLSSLANEKQKAARDAVKGKKKNKKPVAKVHVTTMPTKMADDADYADAYDDLDDFM
ncbi:Translation initiation factor 3 subunit J component [Dispira parvispora]|uniref:Eukaryotic translation initiation factor 3 subunit J n=1 Tax=Dispira parvispora TaxID=1520584 RepID=A0A9W8AIP2_9FUNG|nr:Translation initiation factor 3 subunit J component [Dispira parvispora]